MENNLTKFMEDVSNTLGLITIEKDSPIVYMVPDPDEEGGYVSEPLLSSNSLTFLQPYLSNTRKLIDVKDGKPALVSLPFNPLTEDSIKSETEAFKALKQRISYKLRLSVYELGYLLIAYLQDDCKENSDKEMKEHKIHKTAALGEFLENSIRANTKNVKKIVDDDTFKAWQRVCIGSGNKKIENRKSVLDVSVVKSKTIGKEHFNRLTAVYFPLFEELSQADRTIDNTINGVKLRNKDLEVFTAIFETVTRVCKGFENFTFKVGSNDEEYSSFLSLYSAYLILISNMTSIASYLKPFAEGDRFEILELKIDIKVNELADRLSECSELLKNIPTERSLMLGDTSVQEEQDIPSTSRPKLDKEGIASFGRQPKQQPSHVQITQPVQETSNPYVAPTMQPQQQQQQPVSIDDKAAAMFGSYSHNGGMYPVMPGQQPYGSLLKNVVSAISTGNAGAINLAPPVQQGYMVMPQQHMVNPGYNNFPVAQQYYTPVNQPTYMQPTPTMVPMGMQSVQPAQPDNPLGIQPKNPNNSFSLFK